MIPTIANGQLAAAADQRDQDGIHRAYGLAVLTATATGIARITVFGDDPDLMAKFGLPPVHAATDAAPTTSRPSAAPR